MRKIPYGRQNVTQEDIESVVETLTSDFLTQGPKVKEFEDAFAEYVGAKYAVAVSNATAGLHLSVKSLNLQKGDRVITSPITFAASANCVKFEDGEVWLADIDPQTFLISYDSVKELLESKPKGFFKGLIVVDFAGLPVNLEEFKDLADEYGLWLIEDACHAPGGSFIDQCGRVNYCGNGAFADLSVFSFHPVKHIACGEGGMITTNSEVLYKELMLLRTHGITKENMTENHGKWYYEMVKLGYNYRLTDLQSALGISQLKKNVEGLKRRNEIAELYKKAFLGKIKFQLVPIGAYNAYHLFVILVENRKEVYDHLVSHNIFAQIHYIPIHHLPYYKAFDYDESKLVNANQYYNKCISLPMFPTLTMEEQEYVIEKVLDVAK